MISNAVNSESRKVTCCDGKVLFYKLERKRVKNINLRIHPDGTVLVSAPVRSSLNFIDNFVVSKSSYINNAIIRFSEKRKWKINEKQYENGESFYLLGRQLRLKIEQAEKNYIEEEGVYLKLFCRKPEDFVLKKRLVEKYFKEKSLEQFSVLIKKNYPLFQKYEIKYPSLKIRKMESRWGSCIPSKNQITLNSNLIHFSERCIEYVVIHEFCHFRYPNHSKDFYAFMTVLMPDWKERKWELDNTILM